MHASPPRPRHPTPPATCSHQVSDSGTCLAVSVEAPRATRFARMFLTGELSDRTVRLLVRLLEQQLDEGRTRVVVEGDRLTGLDPAALTQLRASHQRFRDAGGQLLLRGIRLEALRPAADGAAADAVRFRAAAVRPPRPGAAATLRRCAPGAPR